MPDLNGRVAVVTGSTKGIGRAAAERLAASGASVVVSARTASDVNSAVEEIAAEHGVEVRGFPCDVRRPDNCRELIERAVDAFGRLDILVNNAGVGVFAPIQEMSEDDWRKQIEINLGGVFYCSKAAIPHLVESDDAWIVNIASLASRNTFGGGAGYNASKFGLLGMTEAMMIDLRHEGIRVSAIMPGSVDTGFSHPGGEKTKPWALTADDVGRAVIQLMDYPANAHVSRMEMRPSQPPKG